MQMMNALHDGEQMFGIPVLSVNSYLDKIPKEWRWLAHLNFALMGTLAQAFFYGEKEVIRALIGDLVVLTNEET